MKGKLIIITGSSSGIGKSSAIDLLNHGATVIFACRNEEKTKKVIETFPPDLKKNSIFIQLDLADFQSIFNFTNIISEKYKKIDILLNNAGGFPYYYEKTKDNFEHFSETNYIGYFILTLNLLEYMNNESRIIFVSSGAHKIWTSLSKENLNNFFDPDLNKSFYYNKLNVSWYLYADSKLCVMLFCNYLKKLLELKYPNIKIVSLHPGYVLTGIIDPLPKFKCFNLLFKLFYPITLLTSRTPEQGAQTQLYLCYEDYNKLISGGYYIDSKISKIGDLVKNEEFERALIEKTNLEIRKRTNEFNGYINIY